MGRWIDATIWTDGDYNEEHFRAQINPIFERYAYGRERATTTDRPHLQFRGVLRGGPDEERAMVPILSQMGFRHITPTHVRNFDYVFKEGDYYCSWENIRAEYIQPRLRPWQAYFLELPSLTLSSGTRPHQDRTIEFWVDFDGASGKTFFGRYLNSKHAATYIPPLERSSDVLAIVMEKPVTNTYIIDLPRAFLVKRDFFAMVEMLKNGYVYDHRYKFKDKDLGCNPRVAVFCNDVPDVKGCLSKDRIQMYHISGRTDISAPSIYDYYAERRHDWEESAQESE